MGRGCRQDKSRWLRAHPPLSRDCSARPPARRSQVRARRPALWLEGGAAAAGDQPVFGLHLRPLHLRVCTPRAPRRAGRGVVISPGSPRLGPSCRRAGRQVLTLSCRGGQTDVLMRPVVRPPPVPETRRWDRSGREAGGSLSRCCVPGEGGQRLLSATDVAGVTNSRARRSNVRCHGSHVAAEPAEPGAELRGAASRHTDSGGRQGRGDIAGGEGGVLAALG